MISRLGSYSDEFFRVRWLSKEEKGRCYAPWVNLEPRIAKDVVIASKNLDVLNGAL